MTYKVENVAKADFNGIYNQPTPHAYITEMASHGYQIGEQARPYCLAAVDFLRQRNSGACPVQMLDIGCSYGMGSASVRYGCTLDEMDAFLSAHVPKNYSLCCEAIRKWLNVTPSFSDMRCVGVDSSAPAIRFAKGSGLLEGGIARDFEVPDTHPTKEDIRWLRSCNFIISMGAIGYVTERTLSKILPHVGKDLPAGSGLCAVVTILRMFDDAPIARVFEQSGLHFAPVPGIRLLQRNFMNSAEQTKIINILHNKGISTEGWEDKGSLFADLFVAAPPEQMPEFLEKLKSVKSDLSEKE